jgi:uncharacterized protein involved in exopolysaccharide biosynthesis
MSANLADRPVVLSPAPPSLTRAEDEAVDLTPYLLALWRRRWVIVVAAFALAIAVGVVTFIRPRSYTSTVTLLVSQSKIGEEVGAVISPSNFRPLIENNGIVQAVLAKHALDRPPYDLSATRFAQDHLAVEEVRATSIIRLTVTLDDPARAAEVANEIGAEAIALARRLSRDEAVQARDEIGAQLPEAEVRLQKAEDDLLKYRNAAQIELLKREVEMLVGQRGDLIKLDVQIASERARLLRGEQELAQRQQIMTVRRTIDSDPALSEAARQAAGTQSVLGVQLRAEEFSPVYEIVDRDVATSRVRLAALERERAETLKSLGLSTAQLKQLNQLYERERRLDRLTMERDLARKIYEEVATRYQVARLQVAGRSAQLQVVDRATPATQPEPRGTVGRAGTAFVVGLLLAVLAVLAAHAGAALRRAEAAARG